MRGRNALSLNRGRLQNTAGDVGGGSHPNLGTRTMVGPTPGSANDNYVLHITKVKKAGALIAYVLAGGGGGTTNENGGAGGDSKTGTVLAVVGDYPIGVPSGGPSAGAPAGTGGTAAIFGVSAGGGGPAGPQFGGNQGPHGGGGGCANGNGAGGGGGAGAGGWGNDAVCADRPQAGAGGAGNNGYGLGGNGATITPLHPLSPGVDGAPGSGSGGGTGYSAGGSGTCVVHWHPWEVEAWVERV